MPLAPSPWLITDLTPEVIKALDGSIQTGLGRDGSRAPGLALPAAPSFTVSKTATSVTAIITNANGATSYEFSVNGTTWVSGVTVSGLTAATPYDFRGRGINASGTGPSSAVVTVTTNAAVASNNAWQEILESNFFRADSFDDTEDWHSAKVDNYLHTDLPVRTNGEPTMWGRWSGVGSAWALTNIVGTIPINGRVNFSVGGSGVIKRTHSEDGRLYICTEGLTTEAESAGVGDTVSLDGFSATISYVPQFISNTHPTYRDRGKSLCINYDNFNKGILGFGPSRLGVYFGDGSSASGMKKAHVFFMIQFDPEFYQENPDGTFPFLDVHKLFDLCSGHVEANRWGEPEERALMLNTEGGLREYGPNFTIIGTGGGGLSWANRIYLQEEPYKTYLQPNTGWYHYIRVYSPTKVLPLTRPPHTTLIQEPANRDIKWFGIEVAVDLGTVGNSDGSIELWVYNDKGVEQGYFDRRDTQRLAIFDHKNNLMTLGGNRLCNGYDTCPIDGHSRVYIDDVVISPSRIGPTYFQLLTDFEGPL